MRIFIGIPIPGDLTKKITQIQREFKDFDIKFVEPENLHFNLKFLGETEKVPEIKGILEEISKEFKPFKINISGLGVFPSKNYIRVIWIGIKHGRQDMVSLAQAIDEKLTNIGFKKESRFEPHLTLGRVRTGRNKQSLLEKINIDAEIGPMVVNKLILFQSQLSPKGPTYKEIFSVELHG